jgi:RNA polymerase sigma-70 factor (ECF subfamily)
MDEPANLETALRLLMAASLAGDASSYRHLCRELAVLLRRYFRRRLHPALTGHAEDLVQETLMAMHARRLTYDAARPFMPWIYAIARYKLVDLLRQSHHTRSVPIDDVADFLADDRPTDRTAALEDIGKMLETLPAGTADLLKRVKLEEQPVADAARQTGLSETAVKVRLHRGMRALAARFGGRQ